MSQSKQMTIGSLMTALIPFDSGEPVCFDFAGLAPRELSSYRGRYADLAFNTTADRRTAGDLNRQLGLAIGRCHPGWKTGDYYANRDTLLWVAAPGVASGTALIDLKKDPHTHLLTLYTARNYGFDCDADWSFRAGESAPDQVMARKVMIYERDNYVFTVTRMGYGVLEVRMVGDFYNRATRILTDHPLPDHHGIVLISPGRSRPDGSPLGERRSIPWQDSSDKILDDACDWLVSSAEIPPRESWDHERRMGPDRMNPIFDFERPVAPERYAQQRESNARAREYLIYNGKIAP